MVQWGVFPVVLGGALLWAGERIASGVEAAGAIVLPQFVAIVLVVLLERLYPYHRSWNRSRKDVRVDATYGVVIDTREVESNPTPQDVLDFSRNAVSLGPLRRVAVLVNDGALKATEVSAALAGASGFDFQIFDDLDEALRWAQEPD